LSDNFGISADIVAGIVVAVADIVVIAADKSPGFLEDFAFQDSNQTQVRMLYFRLNFLDLKFHHQSLLSLP